MAKVNLKFLLLPIAVLAVAGCGQSDAGAQLDASPVAPSVDSAIKDDAGKPSRITSGQLVYDRAANVFSFDLKGTQGLRVNVRVTDNLAYFEPRSACTPCNPGGGRVGVAAVLVDSSLAGSIDLRGKTYVLGTGPSDAVARLDFFGEGVVLPPATPDGVQLTAPFEFAGMVSVPQADGSSITYTMTGQGVATLDFETTEFDQLGLIYHTARAVYEFQH